VDEDGEDDDGEAGGGDEEAISTASRASGGEQDGKAIASAARGEQAPLLHRQRQGRPRRALLRPRATRRLQRACCRSRVNTLTRSVLRRWERAAAAGSFLCVAADGDAPVNAQLERDVLTLSIVPERGRPLGGGAPPGWPTGPRLRSARILDTVMSSAGGEQAAEDQ
jgi:hypothetical protein